MESSLCFIKLIVGVVGCCEACLTINGELGFVDYGTIQIWSTILLQKSYSVYIKYYSKQARRENHKIMVLVRRILMSKSEFEDEVLIILAY
jgi:hypothetical protein